MGVQYVVFYSGYFMMLFDRETQTIRLPWNKDQIPQENIERVTKDRGYNGAHPLYVLINTMDDDIQEHVPKNFESNVVRFWVTYDEIDRIESVMQYPIWKESDAVLRECYADGFMKELYRANPHFEKRIFYLPTTSLRRNLLIGPSRFETPLDDGDDYYCFFDYGSALKRLQTSVSSVDDETGLSHDYGICRVALKVQTKGLVNVDIDRFKAITEYKMYVYEELNNRGYIMCSSNEDIIITISPEYFTLLDGMLETVDESMLNV